MNLDQTSVLELYQFIDKERKEYLQCMEDYYEGFSHYAIHVNRIIYMVFIGRFKAKGEQEYMKLREYFQCEREMFYSLYAQLSMLKCGFGFENSDKIIEFLKKSTKSSFPGICFWCIPTGNDVLNGTVEFVVFADKQRREKLKLQCDTKEEIVPLKILAIQEKDDIYSFNGISDRLLFLTSHFPGVFTFAIYPQEFKYKFD